MTFFSFFLSSIFPFFPSISAILFFLSSSSFFLLCCVSHFLLLLLQFPLLSFFYFFPSVPPSFSLFAIVPFLLSSFPIPSESPFPSLHILAVHFLSSFPFFPSEPPFPFLFATVLFLLSSFPFPSVPPFSSLLIAVPILPSFPFFPSIHSFHPLHPILQQRHPLVSFYHHSLPPSLPLFLPLSPFAIMFIADHFYQSEGASFSHHEGRGMHGMEE